MAGTNGTAMLRIRYWRRPWLLVPSEKRKDDSMVEITRRGFVGGVGAALLASQSAMGAPGPVRRPNILFICTDTHQADASGFRKHPLVQTPNLDRLASQGTHFTACYCGSPLCAPARASLFSGMFPSDVESYCNATPFRDQVPTWGNCLQDRGYYCMATGKMDLSGSDKLGFEEVLTKHGHIESPDVSALFRRPLCYRIDDRKKIDAELSERPHGDERVLKTAISFLDQKAAKLSQPWALYVGFSAPLPYFTTDKRHFEMYPLDTVPMPPIPAGYLENLPLPWEATRGFKRVTLPLPEDRVRRARAAYYGSITALDERVGKLLDHLDRIGLRQNTLVIYTSDHGLSTGEHGLWFHNEPTDRSSRVPLIVCGPGIPAGRRVDMPVMHVDLFPTLMEVSETPLPPAKLRGHSLLPLCHGRPGNHPGVAYSECHAEGTCTGSFILRKGSWKYIHYTYYDSLLFNLEEDPEELHDVIGTPQGKKVAAELHEVLCSLVSPTERTEAAFARQERMLTELCAKMSLEELLTFGFEKRLGRGQALTLLKKYKR
jgi:choline-sulfatase